MRLYWWGRIRNLGDEFTARLLRSRGVEVEWAAPMEAEFVGVGSVLESFDGASATIWGTGRFGSSSPPTDLSRARVLALRGTSTRALTTSAPPALGDPGLLAPALEPRWDGGYTAIVPHWQDQERLRALYTDATFVDVMGDPETALRTIAGADAIVSSSLHGLVFADAYGIPRMWDRFRTLGTFKFTDYGSVVGYAAPGEWFTPDPLLIEGVRKELDECLTV